MRKITEELLEEYEKYLTEEEKRKATISKYLCDLRKFLRFAGEKDVTKELTMSYKENLL